jgi:hypothetical protein
MPREIKNKEEFQRLLPLAEEVRVIRRNDLVKLKIRTRDLLYTFKTTNEDADSLIKGLKVEVLDF